MVASAMQREGLSRDEARERCLFIDSKGLVVASRKDLSAQKRVFAQERQPLPDIAAAVESFRPTALVGATGKGGLFTQAVLEAMARVNERPIVLALSNPTSKAECTAEQAYALTEGRAIFAAGSQLEPVRIGDRLYAPGQGNNSYIFPGVGLGLLVSGAKRMTDEMFLAAAEALAAQASQRDLEQGRIFPAASRMREVAGSVAAAVAATAHEQGHASKPRPRDLRAEAARSMYEPGYT
jgi:malate dehydrogenase (oxaloacetate-decarboxylating)(NADP+)